MNGDNMASGSRPRTVTLDFTKKIEALLEERGQFPALRPQNALRVFSSVSRHVVPVEEARALLEFFGTVAAGRNLPRGLPFAVASMRDHIRRALDDEQEAFAREALSPGLEALRAGLAEASALLKVGDRARLFDAQGQEVEIVHAFDLYACPDPSGPYVCEFSGMRVDYRPGYLVCPVGVKGAALFVRAGGLWSCTGQRTHLALVESGHAARHAA